MATWGPTSVSETNDDARWVDAGSAYEAPNDSDGQKFGYVGTELTHFACRFQNVTIPNAATINSATLKVTNGYMHLGVGETITSNIYGFDVDDCNHFDTDTTGTHPENNAKTTAYVAWNWDENDGVGQYESGDIKTIIQEIVNRESWASGNALGLCLYVSAADDFFQIEDVASDGAAAILEIDYTEGGGGSSVVPIILSMQRRMRA